MAALDFSTFGELVESVNESNKPKAPAPASENPDRQFYQSFRQLTFQRGDKGPDVSEMQQALVDAGVTSIKKVDGAFGINTEKGVQEFQEMRGLPETGIFDEATQSALFTDTTSTPASDEPEEAVTPDVSVEEVAEVEKRYSVTDSSLDSIYATKGPAYRDSQVVSHSYYKTPIVDRFEKGTSRRGGDATREVQKAAIEAIITQGVRYGLSKDEIALTLAIAKHESGFNPDAAAGTTSAHGLGQFINSTGKTYGLVNNNRWQIGAQARALVKHTKDNIELAKRRGKGTEYVYKYHHDGPTKDYGGLVTSKNKVMPLVSSFGKMLDGLDIPEKPTPKPKPDVKKELAPEKSLRPVARPEAE